MLALVATHPGGRSPPSTAALPPVERTVAPVTTGSMKLAVWACATTGFASVTDGADVLAWAMLALPATASSRAAVAMNLRIEVVSFWFVRPSFGRSGFGYGCVSRVLLRKAVVVWLGKAQKLLEMAGRQRLT